MHSSMLEDKRGWRLAQGRGDLTDASLAGLRRAGAAHQHRCRSIAKRAKSWSVAVSLPDKDGIQPWRACAVCRRRQPISALEPIAPCPRGDLVPSGALPPFLTLRHPSTLTTQHL